MSNKANTSERLGPAINLDANATYPMPQAICSELRELISPLLNPSSIHSGGQLSRNLIEQSRESIAQLLSLSPSDRVIFTSGATESNNTVFNSAFSREQAAPASEHSAGCDCVISAIEHPSVISAARRLQARGITVSVVRPEPAGGEFISNSFCAACGLSTRLASVMLANNETGQILPVSKISNALKSAFPMILVHCDAVQAIGKLPVAFNELGVDMLSLSAHKLGGLAGIGALVLRGGIELDPLIIGGPQEQKRRGGTENILGIASFGIAARFTKNQLAERIACMRSAKAALTHALLQNIEDLSLNFSHVDSLPNTLSLHIPGVLADDLVVALDLAGLYISAGAACSSGKPEPSPVLLAMGLSEQAARETVRLSLHAEYADGEIDRAADTIVRCIKRMRANSASHALRAANH